MTAPTCVVCGSPVADGYVDRSCARDLAQTLQTASGHAGDAEAVLSRQTRYTAGARGGSGKGLTPDPKTAARYAAIEGAIGGWARIVSEETGRRPKWRPYLGPPCPPARPGDAERESNRCDHDSCEAARQPRGTSTLALEAAWLSRPRQIEFLRKHPAAAEAFKELQDACRDLARLVDRPADRELVGVCDCGKVLYAVEGRAFITCPMPTCKLIWNVDESRDILRKHLGDKLVTAAEAAWLSAYLDTDRTQEQIRKLINKWAERALVEVHGRLDGEQAFRFGEIAARLAATPRRTREQAAA